MPRPAANGLRSVLSVLGVALAACSDAETPEPLGLAPAEVPTAGPLAVGVLADSSLVQDTAYTAQGNVEDLVGAVVNLSDGTITKSDATLGKLAAPAPVRPTGGTGSHGRGAMPDSGGASTPTTGDRPPPPIGGPQLDVWCMVRIWYSLDTGLIISVHILYCWDEGNNKGGNGGGNNNKNNQSVTFTLSCPHSVRRGDEGRCSVTAATDDGELIQTGGFTFSWSSSTGASTSGKGKDEWKGVATDDATVTVEVNGFSDSKDVNVRPRLNWAFRSVRASWVFDTSLRSLGLYDVPTTPSQVPSATGGSGPWKNRYYMKNPPRPSTQILVNTDYSSYGRQYAGARGTCPPKSNTLSTRANYSHVNFRCGTDKAWKSFRDDILIHERDHESGINDCLTTSAAASKAAREIEAITDKTAQAVSNATQLVWDDFYKNSLLRSGFRARAFTSGPVFHWKSLGWNYSYPGIRNHPGGQHSC